MRIKLGKHESNDQVMVFRHQFHWNGSLFGDYHFYTANQVILSYLYSEESRLHHYKHNYFQLNITFLETGFGTESKWLYEHPKKITSNCCFVPDEAQDLVPFKVIDPDALSDLLVIVLGYFKYITNTTRDPNQR